MTQSGGLPPTANCRIAEGSFDHFVCDREYRWRDFDSERPRLFQVDGKYELGRLHHREVGGLDALENLAGIDADLTIRFHNVGSVAP